MYVLAGLEASDLAAAKTLIAFRSASVIVILISAIPLLTGSPPVMDLMTVEPERTTVLCSSMSVMFKVSKLICSLMPSKRMPEFKSIVNWSSSGAKLSSAISVGGILFSNNIGTMLLPIRSTARLEVNEM